MSTYIQDDCAPETVTVFDRGAPGLARTFCTTHTYFGNGIEPNDWPCDPVTRKPPALTEEADRG